MKILISSLILLNSIWGISQNRFSPDKSQRLQEAYQKSWKIYEITGDREKEYLELLTLNFFICQAEMFGFYNKELEEMTFDCCWERSVNQIIILGDSSSHFELIVKVWTESQITLRPINHPEVDIKLKK